MITALHSPKWHWSSSSDNGDAETAWVLEWSEAASEEWIAGVWGLGGEGQALTYEGASS